MNILNNVAKYIQQITGYYPSLKIAPDRQISRLPLYLSYAYGFYNLTLWNRTVLLAVVNENSKSILSQIVKDHEQIQGILQRDIALVLPPIMSYERKRLIEKRVPFVVPGRQMFLPMLALDFRESFPAPPAPRGIKTLNWVGQVVILRHLLFNDMVDRPLVEVASLLGYSAMAISKAIDQLLVLNLCQKILEGRTKTIRFNIENTLLWKSSLDLMRSPVRKRFFVKWRNPRKAFYSNMTGLSHYTNIAAAPKTIYALSNKIIRDLLADGRMIPCAFEEDAKVILEAWAYRPDILSEGPAVDPLSLFLSLRGDRDERVQMVLDQLWEKWK